MAGIDKAAITWTIAIAALGAGIAAAGDSPRDQGGAATVDEPEGADAAEDATGEVAEEEISREGGAEEAEEAPKTAYVAISAGTSVRGCEATGECYIPTSVSINTGDTVRWNNADAAAHTVTSGIATDGPDGMFDSSLLMAGDSYGVVFYVTGSYDYYCLVHAWMGGSVEVS